MPAASVAAATAAGGPDHDGRLQFRNDCISTTQRGAAWASIWRAMQEQLDSVGAAASAAFHVCPNLERVVGVMLEGPLEELESRCSLTPGEASQCTKPLLLPCHGHQ